MISSDVTSRTRLIASHLLIGVFAPVTVMIILVAYTTDSSFRQEYNRQIISSAAIDWLQGREPRSTEALSNLYEAHGFGIVVDGAGQVLYTEGDDACLVGQMLRDCAPAYVDMIPGHETFTRDGQTWWRLVAPLRGDAWLISERVILTEPVVRIRDDLILYGYAQILLFSVGLMGLVALCVSLLIVLPLVRWQTRRLEQVATASRSFARGDFSARVLHPRDDVIGRLGQQFNSMADALQGNIDGLRALAQRNLILAQEVEHIASQAERSRVTRDLHDTIAQQIYDLTVSSSALPALIENDLQCSIEDAEAIAIRAEDALIHLRQVLLDLRPQHVAQMGFADTIENLCDIWQSRTGLPVARSIMLGQQDIPLVISDYVLRSIDQIFRAVPAQASSMDVTLIQGQSKLTLVVCAHDIPKPTQLLSFELREQIRALSGDLSHEYDGCYTVKAVLPLSAETII